MLTDCNFYQSSKYLLFQQFGHFVLYVTEQDRMPFFGLPTFSVTIFKNHNSFFKIKNICHLLSEDISINSEGLFVCRFCDMAYMFKDSLKKHLPLHKGKANSSTVRAPLYPAACIFFIQFLKTISLFQGGFFRKLYPFVWLVFKSDL